MNIDRASVPSDFDFRKIVEDLQVMVCIYDIHSFIYINPAFERVTGYTLEEVRKKKFWEITHPDEWEWLIPRGLARLQGEDVPVTTGFQIITKAGETIWVNVFYLVTEWGGASAVLIAFADVTETKRLTDELQAARDALEIRVAERTEELNRTNKELLFLNQNLHNILQNITDGVITIKRSGEIEIMNSFSRGMSDRSIADIKAGFKDWITKKKTGYLKKMLEEKEAFRDEEIIFSTSEGSLPFLISGTPILNDKGVVESGVIILKPMKEVHRLINRFSGYQASFCFDDIITMDKVMLALIENAKSTALNTSNVLIEGESGTGKELFAQAIHNHGPRHQGPFIAVNCGGIPRELIGSELFGYVEGAFTGAKKGGNPGKFELAAKGTLFLDEIGDMPLELQSSLLRVIQEKKVTRIGGHQALPVDVRIICATNKDLHAEMKRHCFRQDLYYRLNVINIKIPPLRERRADAMLLFNHFLNEARKRSNRDIYRLNNKMRSYLLNYDWPGNVRELHNVVERMVNMTGGTYLDIKHLPPEIIAASHSSRARSLSSDKPKGTASALDLKETRRLYKGYSSESERSHILDVLRQLQGNVSRTARELGISRTTLYKKLKVPRSG